MTSERGRIFGRPPHSGPRRPRTRRTVRSVATQCIQLQQSPAEHHHSLVLTASVSPAVELCSRPGTATADDDQLTVNLLHIDDTSQPSPGQSSSAPAATRTKDESRDAEVWTSRLNPRRAGLSLDNVDLWDDVSDSELTNQTPRDVDMTTSANHDERRAAELAEEPTTCDKTNSHQLMSREASTVDAWTGRGQSKPTSQVESPQAVTGAGGRGFIPSIIESSGRPATANRCAADLSDGSVELRHQRRTGAGLNAFIRGMQLALTGNRDRSTRSEVKVTQAGRMRRLNHDVTLSQHQHQQHSAVDRLHLTSELSRIRSTLRFH